MSVSKETSDTDVKKTSDFSILGILTSTLKKVSFIGVVYLAGYMQWSVAWLIGPLVLSVIREHWKQSRDQRRNAAKLVALSSEKEVVLARLNDLPAWVFFPDIERAEWLNRIMKQLWPSVNLFVKQIVRDSIQPKLKESLEKFKLSGFKFERIILGTVPFRIGGVKVYDKNIDRNEIVMDLDIFYAGDCDVTFYLSGIKGGIKDFQLHGMLRVVMKPLITSPPLVGGLQVFFLNNPDIDFDLVGVADVLDIPGLSDILRRIVLETVANLMVLPNKFPIKLSEEVEAIDLKTPEPEGVLRVHVVEAKHLMKKDIGMLGKGKSDPYAVITVGAQNFKTKVIDNTVDPKWDYWCEATVSSIEAQYIDCSCFDWDPKVPGQAKDDFLGRATVEISNIVSKGTENTWVVLEQAKHGMIHLRFTWLSLSKDYNDLKSILAETQMLQVSTLSTSLFTVFVDSAKNLPQARMSTKPDPYVTLRVGGTTQETAHIMRTIHPVWENGFTFLVANPENDSFYLNVLDKKTNSDIGHFTFKIKSLADKPDLQVIKQPFPLSKSGPESKIVLSMHLRILKRVQEEQPQSSQPMPLERTESTISTASTDSTQALFKPSDGLPSALKQTEPSGIEELIEDSTVLSLNLAPEINTGEQLIHRNPSVTTSAGEAGLGRIQLTLRYSVQRQRLIVVVHKIANIPLKDPSNIPDPYVKLYLLPERAKDSKRKTQVIKDNCNPVFDETFEYVINQAELVGKRLEVTVCSQKQLFTNNSLGQVILDLSQLNLTQPYNAWLDLECQD
ncbi:extended synaptotagmin-2 isoform X1 [Euwallacea fornicatus]|uniref:extended synaptotagmin-2 isoform X1 n=1 Tax=Euwallacea fornicatus TaxID=995702 RepID=UPI00338D7018